MSDVTLTARYDLPAGTTAADLAELLLTVPADARIGFMVPLRSVQSYADVEPPAAPRTLTATWTVPAGQPLTPPNVADDMPAAGWADPTDVSDCGALTDEDCCRCKIAGVQLDEATGYALDGPEANFIGHEARRRAEQDAAGKPDDPALPECPTCGRSGDEPCVGSLTGGPIAQKHLSRTHREADAQHAAAEARREAIRTETRRRLEDPIALGGTGL